MASCNEKPTREEIVAHHEAGHAVAACLARVPFRTVTIIPDEISDGKVALAIWDNFDPDLGTDRRTTERCKACIFATLAGPVSEMRLTQNKSLYDDPNYSDDMDTAFTVAHKLIDGRVETTNAYLQFMEEQTRDVMELWYDLVEVIAQELLDKKMLKAQDVRHLLRNHMELDNLPSADLI